MVATPVLAYLTAICVSIGFLKTMAVVAGAVGACAFIIIGLMLADGEFDE